jgi:methionyl-tRNA formyltransferase
VTGAVLFLGRDDSPVLAWLREHGEITHALGPNDPLDRAALDEVRPAWIVSHGYARLLRADVLGALPGRFINLHISLLPWNRGADPVLWSVLDDTPRGVTIHVIDEGLDTGPVLAQAPVELVSGDTFTTLYARHTRTIAELFARSWPGIRTGTLEPTPQRGSGSLHRVKDRLAIEQLLVDGWNTPVAALLGRAR